MRHFSDGTGNVSYRILLRYSPWRKQWLRFGAVDTLITLSDKIRQIVPPRFDEDGSGPPTPSDDTLATLGEQTVMALADSYVIKKATIDKGGQQEEHYWDAFTSRITLSTIAKIIGIAPESMPALDACKLFFIWIGRLRLNASVPNDNGVRVWLGKIWDLITFPTLLEVEEVWDKFQEELIDEVYVEIVETNKRPADELTKDSIKRLKSDPSATVSPASPESASSTPLISKAPAHVTQVLVSSGRKGNNAVVQEDDARLGSGDVVRSSYDATSVLPPPAHCRDVQDRTLYVRPHPKLQSLHARYPMPPKPNLQNTYEEFA